MSLFSNNTESFHNPQENFGEDKNEITKETAEAEINMVMQEVSVMGANDHELGTLREILDDLKKERISPQEAITKAVNIRESKQDYH
ncbi:hypothetical protein IT402_02240 [Candidatus Nomurabacteria bacterium]|nr:hypothetical protein [Candidatus Nomurabacteria bacterium]